MTVALTIGLLWLVFGGTHVGLSSQRVRVRVVSRIGERAYQGAYSLLALAIFIPLAGTYFAHKATSPLLWLPPGGTLWLWTIQGVVALAFVMLVAALVSPSPASIAPGAAVARGIYRLTRHPLVMSLAIFGGAHLLVNGRAADVAFFGGFIGFGLVGAWHQDRRKLAAADEAFRSFHAETPFLPFTGSGRWLGLRELNPRVVGIGIGLAVLVRTFHRSWF